MIFLLMSLAAVLVFIVAPIAGAVWAVYLWRRGNRRRAAMVGTAVTIVLAVGVDAFFIEPRALEVTHVEIVSDAISEPLTIAVIADLQTDAVGDYERAVLERVAAEDPDLVLFPGDFVQVPRDAFAAESAELNALLREVDLHPRLGAYAVPGNIELGNPDWADSFWETGVETWPDRRRVDLGPIVLTGLPLVDSFDTDIEIPAADKFHVAFGHAPDFSLGDVEADLMIAGHTHGGQVRLPFIGPLITFSKVPRAHAAGHTVLPDGRSLVVSRGIGMERGAAPRLRFLCRPELVFVHVRPD